MNRRAIREHTFKLLFCIEFYPKEELGAQFARYFEEESLMELPPEEKQLLIGRAQEIAQMVPELDALLAASMEGWKMNRIGKAELSILRLAVYELKCDPEVPWKVAINEAVELAKKYGGDDAPGFVNGVLARVIARGKFNTDGQAAETAARAE